MHWSRKYASEWRTAIAAKANWSSTVITEPTWDRYQLDVVTNDDSTSWWMDLGLPLPSYSNWNYEICKQTNKQKQGGKGGFGAKMDFSFLDLILSGPTWPKPQVWEGWWPSWVSCGLALGFQKTMTSYDLRFTHWPKSSLPSARGSYFSPCARSPLPLRQCFSTKSIPGPLG